MFEGDYFTIPYDLFDQTDREELLITLEEFDIGYSEKLPFGKLAPLQRLRCLDLTGVHLHPDTFRMEVCTLTELRMLTLMYADIREIPREIGNLVHLEHLCLRGNYIETLPDEMANLRELKELNLIDNRISELPDFLVDLPNVKSISIWGNLVKPSQVRRREGVDFYFR